MTLFLEICSKSKKIIRGFPRLWYASSILHNHLREQQLFCRADAGIPHWKSFMVTTMQSYLALSSGKRYGRIHAAAHSDQCLFHVV